jgi:hypothetical protein
MAADDALLDERRKTWARFMRVTITLTLGTLAVVALMAIFLV